MPSEQLHAQERKEGKKLFTNHFGIEIEFTGVTRCQAAKVAARYLGGTISKLGDYYDTHQITARDGRVWKFMYDGSLTCQHRSEGRIVDASRKYSVEMVSPVLLYREDIGTLQGLVRDSAKPVGSLTHPAASTSIWMVPTTHLGAFATL